MENVNHPSHYQQGIEAIDIIESWGLNFSLGNVIKYTLRAPYKGKQIEDLEKARWYLDREIERLKIGGRYYGNTNNYIQSLLSNNGNNFSEWHASNY